jgi:SsrA-binding protein
MLGMKKPTKVFASNRQASYQFDLQTRYEAGLVLEGWEVVAIRQGQLNITNSYVTIKNREAFLIGAHINPLKTATSQKIDSERTRKLLLNTKELNKLIGATAQKGMSIVPIKVYDKSGRMKIAIALAKGKKTHDKRQAVKEREINRETLKSLKDIRG